MAKYLIMSRRGWLDDDGAVPEMPSAPMMVYETDPEPIKTGLLDAAGNPLYRVPDPRRIGFFV